jgi:hypothetical protein
MTRLLAEDRWLVLSAWDVPHRNALLSIVVDASPTPARHCASGNVSRRPRHLIGILSARTPPPTPVVDWHVLWWFARSVRADDGRQEAASGAWRQ